MEQSKDKNNNEKTGMIAGLLIPIATMIIYYLFENPGDFILFIKQIFMGGSYSRIFGMCIIPNFVIFFVFRWQKKYKASEGVTIATLIYLIIIVILKYIN